MSDKPNVFYVTSSHWDREWYLPFQAFRHKLVDLFDSVLHQIDAGELQGPFTCDGQSILIEDYLEIRPEQAGRLREEMRKRNLIFGPWYVLPDEFLVSGESMIRNLRIGRALVREWGAEPSDAGFVCDLFGHASQMPQILAGFGIRAALVWRGVQADNTAVLRWLGADGTLMPTFVFPEVGGYGSYPQDVRSALRPGKKLKTDGLREIIQTYIEKEIKRAGENIPALLFDGLDHLFPDPRHYAELRELMDDKNLPYTVKHASLDEFLDALVPHTEKAPEARGELRKPVRYKDKGEQAFLLVGVASSRVWIKQENDQCEALLCHWAEPFTAMESALTGSEVPDGFLRTAWKWLLKNHPHDSICGCSIDEVHENMRFRFSQCRQIADTVSAKAFTGLSLGGVESIGERERRMTIFNPLPFDREEVFELDVEIPDEWPEFTEYFGYESKPAFRLIDSSGSELPYQRLKTRRDRTRFRMFRYTVCDVSMVHVVTVALKLRLPAMGFAALKIAGLSGPSPKKEIVDLRAVEPTRYPDSPGLRTGHASMENEFLTVEIQSNGGLSLTDKSKGRVYRNLNLLEDDPDLGDGWNHGYAVHRHRVISSAGRVRMEVDCDTPLQTSFIVLQEIDLPEAYDEQRNGRSQECVRMVFQSRITLRAGARFLEVESEVRNPAEDHRLCLVFPTGVESDSYLTDAAFDVIERSVVLPADNHLQAEMEVDMKPQRSWTAISDSKGGLAVVCGSGLHEGTVLNRPDRPIVLTAFRSTGKTVFTDGESGGQMRGDLLRFTYRLVPVDTEIDRTSLFAQGQDLLAGIRACFFDAIDLASPPSASSVADKSMLHIGGGAVLSSFRRVGQGFELRLFNPSEESIQASVELAPDLGVTDAVFVNFESVPLNETAPALDAGSLRFELAPKQIRTLSLKRDGEN